VSNHHRVVVAVAIAKVGHEAALKGRLEGVAKASWAEAEVVSYAVHDVIDQPGQFMMVEVYASDQAFDDHLATPHVVALIADIGDMLEGELIVYQGKASAFSSGAKGAL
jgi:quinol monooxygenase YgiN